MKIAIFAFSMVVVLTLVESQFGGGGLGGGRIAKKRHCRWVQTVKGFK